MAIQTSSLARKAAARSEEEIVAATPKSLYIDGSWRDSSTGRAFEVEASAQDALAALDAAQGPNPR